MPEIHLTDDAAADELLSSNPLALLIGMLLESTVRRAYASASATA